jgi:cyclase
MDRDGTGAGFDCELTRVVSEALRIPVIASGGGGDTQSFLDVFQRGKADAALAASIFHFGLRRLADLKQELQTAGIPMRLPC